MEWPLQLIDKSLDDEYSDYLSGYNMNIVQVYKYDITNDYQYIHLFYLENIHLMDMDNMRHVQDIL